MSRSPHEEAPGEEQEACTEEHGERLPRRRGRERVVTIHAVPELPTTLLNQCTRREAARGVPDVIRAEDDSLPRAQLRVGVVSVLERCRAFDNRCLRDSEQEAKGNGHPWPEKEEQPQEAQGARGVSRRAHVQSQFNVLKSHECVMESVIPAFGILIGMLAESDKPTGGPSAAARAGMKPVARQF